LTPRGLVIFDCDGVLVDSEGISMRELARSIARVGGTLTLAEVTERFVGLSLADVIAHVEAHLGRPVPAGWLDTFVKERAEAFERVLLPVPGAAEAVEGVRALGWETCVASGGRMEKMAQTLRVTGLWDLFPPDRIFSVTLVERGKPAPDLFLHAARVCGFDSTACVVVEDSVPGLAAARAAGMRALAYTNDDVALAARAAPLGAEPLSDMRELPARL